MLLSDLTPPGCCECGAPTPLVPYLLWEARFGEPMPPSARRRRREPPRTERVPVMLTRAELERLDARRGGLTRSEYLRRGL